MKRIIAIILTVVLVAGLGAGVGYVNYQPKSSVTDNTKDTQAAANMNASGSVTPAAGGGNSSGGDGNESQTATISSDVHTFSEDENQQINNSITSVKALDDSYEISFNNQLPKDFSSLGNGDIFFLNGDANTPMGEPYFGKVESIENNGSGIEVVSEAPTVDEVFDQFTLEMSEAVSDGTIKSIQTIPGVTVKQGESLDTVDLTLASKKQTGSASDNNTESLSRNVKNNSAGNTAVKLGNKAAASVTSLVYTNSGKADGGRTDGGKTNESNINKDTTGESSADGGFREVSETQTGELKGSSFIFEFEDVDLGKLFNIVSNKTSGKDIIPELVTKEFGGDSENSNDETADNETADETKDNSTDAKTDEANKKAAGETADKSDDKSKDKTADKETDTSSGNTSDKSSGNTSDQSEAGKEKEENSTALTMSGKIGLDNIQVRANMDYSLAYKSIIRNMSVGAGADFVANIKVDYTMLDVEIGAPETEAQLASWVKLQGLNKKAFPIAYFDVATKQFVTVFNGSVSDKMDVLTKLPVSLGVLVYSDIEGNLTISASFEWSMRKEIDSGDFVFVKDGQFVMQRAKNDTLDSSPEYDWEVSVGVEADVDATVAGVSAQVYICNLNIVDVALVKLGIEAEGKASISAGSDTSGIEPSAEGYIRGYLKLIDINIGFNAKFDIFSMDSSIKREFQYTVLDITIFKAGEKSPTNYDPESMTYEQLVASDGDYVYYKDLSGYLIRASADGGGRLTIDKDTFFSICGIDETYIYVLKNTDSAGIYDIYRTAKDGTSSRAIVNDVKWVLYSDRDYLYYVPDFDNCSIERVNRQTLKTETFAKVKEPVELMVKQDKFFLVSCAESNFFFGNSMTYYHISLDGKKVDALGSDLSYENYEIRKEGKADYRVKIIGNGYLRTTAQEMYVQPSDGSKPVLTEMVSGWNDKEDGLFTTVNSTNNSGCPFEIVVYSPVTGKRSHVADVQSNQAFFTLVKDDLGNWYYIDQTDTQLILYKMNSNFGKKTVLQTFDTNKINYNLDQCSMSILENRIYFYSMPDNQTSKMIYRYSLYE